MRVRRWGKFLCAILIPALSLCASVSLLAWSAPGHMTIAAIAYRDLPASSKSSVTELLQHHPDYAKWTASYKPDSGIDLPTFIFMRASTWPDEIRRKSNPHDHPQWHYVNYPLIAPEFPDKPNPFPTNDILYGIAQCEKIVSDKKAAPELRAVYLSWLIHLVGDIHQPLHCVALINSSYPPPQGDKGGNDFFVKPNSVGVNLHGIWDKALGSSVNPRSQYNAAIEISATHKRKSLSELSKYKNAVSWSKESRLIAIESGYLNGNLKGSTKPADAPELPDGYTKNMKPIAERLAAIAGYRLADDVKKSVK